jgi:alkanesulfonate monooxygenase SsuD/methylene tetrahydromethanopterin reductase-like flavin-dependent oxidoreductase (luciferase family)
MGMQEEREHLYACLLGGGFDALPSAAPDALVETFSIAGTPDEAAEKLRAFEGAVDHLVLHCPYVPPIDAASSEDAFRSMVNTFSRETFAR